MSVGLGFRPYSALVVFALNLTALSLSFDLCPPNLSQVPLLSHFLDSLHTFDPCCSQFSQVFDYSKVILSEPGKNLTHFECFEPSLWHNIKRGPGSSRLWIEEHSFFHPPLSPRAGPALKRRDSIGTSLIIKGLCLSNWKECR